jgi:hypothetical protein
VGKTPRKIENTDHRFSWLVHFGKSDIAPWPKIPESTLRDVADGRDGPGTPTAWLYVGLRGARPREKSKIPIPGSGDGDFQQK